jgi:hypothetical protein
MNEPWSDDERVAALLDGKLGERERAEMMAYLAAKDDAYKVFAGTAVILREAEGEHDGATSTVQVSGGNNVVITAGGDIWEDYVRGVPYELDQFETVSGADAAVLDTLTEEFDALFDRMQTPEADAAMDRAFNASPEELGRAAAAAARRRAR